jgi:hypothetical protein
MPPVLFADSNVFIEALLIPQSAAYVVDTEDAIVGKLGQKPEALDEAITNWEKLKNDIRLIVLEDPDDPDTARVLATRDKYLGVMRHKADIPVLAAALSMNPAPQRDPLRQSRALQRCSSD